MTRARKHLILSGVAPADRYPNEKRSDPPFDWLRNFLHLRWERDGNFGKVDFLEDVNGARIRLHICTEPEAAAERYRQAGSSREAQESPEVDKGITRMPEAAIYVPPVISPTALDTFRACPRRYYFSDVLRVGGLFDIRGTGKAAADGGVLPSTDLGTLVHAVLETNLPAPGSEPVTTRLLDEKAAQVLSKPYRLTTADHELAMRSIENLKRLPVAGELFGAAAAGELQTELSFSTLIGQATSAGQTILQGQIDALCPDHATGGTLVVDYKTGTPHEGASVQEAAHVYRLQMTAYALAAGRMRPGPVRVVLAYLGGETPVEAPMEFAADDIPALETELQSAIDDMADGAFPPLEKFDVCQCAWCPGGPHGARLCLPA